MKFYDTEVDFDITNPEQFDAYGQLVQKFKAAAEEAGGDFKALMVKSYEAVKAGAEALFGNDAAAQLCGEKVSARRAMQLYCALLGDYKAQLDEFEALKAKIETMFSEEVELAEAGVEASKTAAESVLQPAT